MAAAAEATETGAATLMGAQFVMLAASLMSALLAAVANSAASVVTVEYSDIFCKKGRKRIRKPGIKLVRRSQFKRSYTLYVQFRMSTMKTKLF